MTAGRDRQQGWLACGPGPVIRLPERSPAEQDHDSCALGQVRKPVGQVRKAQVSGPSAGHGRLPRRAAAHSADLAPSPAELRRLHRVAGGQEDADLIVHGGTLVVVHTGELQRRDLLIVGRFIAAVTQPGALSARRALDASGRYLLPAYVDENIRVERTLLTPGELARVVVPRGTVTLLADTSRLTALCGPRGGQLATATRTPMRLLEALPVTPAMPAAMTTMVPRQPVSLPESAGGPPLDVTGMPGAFPVGPEPDGFGPVSPSGPTFGSGSGSASGGLPVERTADDDPWEALLEASDGRTVIDLVVRGHLGRDVRRAVKAGMDPLTAVRMATLAPARRHGLDHLLGSLTPTHLADIQIVSEIAGPHPPEVVLSGGRLAAERGRPLFDNLDVIPAWARERLSLPPGLHSGSFTVPAASLGSAGRAVNGVQVILIQGEEPCVEVVMVRPAVTGGVTGCAEADPEQNLLKVALVTCRADQPAGTRVGFIRGIGLRQGAIAMTTSVAPGDLAIIGAGDHDMMTAARALEGMGGGFVVVDRGWVLAACPLPVAGVMSDAPWDAVRDQLDGVDAAAAALGCTLAAPFLTLAPLGQQLYCPPS
ncbi:adenine deaminase C-terminal domain-containing protein [Protofrankia symbiont of Coriaria ruscifolia]|uniref:adenine deaminase C-terminal domain-containing protein n=1 Tax=Protofrankia symbiont of Coriaria ruscifolia TaxID=1306542 RepID=UPI0010417655|nr:adenine deaminase C-terminal domain-containing protein [Protofrankia symbiont of Coriaria ruscifolia]